MSRGSSSAVLAPVADAGGGSPADSDERLVAAVRHGDDRAFEALYSRYQRRIHAYVLGMVKDHGRAEDVTQEVFVSALRRMRATERPIAFKPWVYEIAKNACIDAFRRSKRAEEISYDAEEGLAPADHSRLAAPGPSPEAAVAAKHELETLCGAFGGLSESHHQILVLRELEGLTYDQIGARMGMTRPAVESTLFRARRRLTEEYDDLVSGARCQRVQSIIATAVSGAVGVRDSRRLSRHLAHCQPCRREALEAGLDRGLLVRRPARERIAGKVAALLPFPAFLRFRRGVDAPPPGARLSAHLPALSDQLGGPWAKAVTGAALLVAGVGVGTGVHEVASRPDRAASPPVVVAPAAAKKTQSSPAAGPAATRTPGTGRDASSRSGGTRGDENRRSATLKKTRSGNDADRATSVGGGSPSGSAPSSPPAAGGGGGSSEPAGASKGSSGSTGSTGSSGGSGGAGGAVKPPSVNTPSADKVKDQVQGTVQQTTGAVQQTVDGAADTVDGTVGGVTGGVQGAVGGLTGGVNGAVQGATGGGPVADTVKGATDTVNQTVDGVKKTVDGAAGAVTGTVKQTADALLGGHGASG